MEQLVEVGKEVVDGAHSYAGVAVCEVAMGLGKRERFGQRKGGRVVQRVLWLFNH